MRYDLAFFLCCCKSFLGPSVSPGEPGKEDFYELLGIERDATSDEIKRAYKRNSLMMHPDKFAQRGQQVTDADQARFQRMKEAYEALSDPHKRETYDAIGEKGMRWIEEPFSLDPQEMARNFANSSTLDRSKIFGIFVGVAIALFLLPFLICLKVDNNLGPAPWTALLTPLWIWNAFVTMYHVRVIMMGPTVRPDNIPEVDWVDPLPITKRMFSLFRFSLIVLFELLASLRLDNVLKNSWSHVFFPIYIWEATTLYKKLPLARMRIVTVDDLETALGKSFAEFTQAEKELISRRYSVVPAVDSPEFEAAHKLKNRARQDVIKVAFHAIFLLFLITQLDTDLDWNWWFVFSPFWIMSFCICCGSYQSFAEVQTAIAEKDPEMMKMMGKRSNDHDDPENQHGGRYGAMGPNGHSTKDSSSKQTKKISEEERNELKAQFMQSGYRMISSFCSQAFILIIVALFVGKIQGAGYSSLWIISPLLCTVGIILLCLGCTIFCITEVTEETSGPMSGSNYTPPDDSTKNTTSTSTWDPEKGQVWEDPSKSTANAPTVMTPVPPLLPVTTPPMNVNDTLTATGTYFRETPLTERMPGNSRVQNTSTTAIDELD